MKMIYSELQTDIKTKMNATLKAAGVKQWTVKHGVMGWSNRFHAFVWGYMLVSTSGNVIRLNSHGSKAYKHMLKWLDKRTHRPMVKLDMPPRDAAKVINTWLNKAAA